jgi:4'-phosphopantetheinyl transferase EntD
MPDLAALVAAAQAILPAAAKVAAADPAQAPAPLCGEALPNAVPKRQREFAAGRRAAHDALAQLGQTGQPIPIGADRAPVWPAGFNGSITHSDRLCLAAVIQAPVLIGIDLEPATVLPRDLWETVLRPEEITALIDRSDAGQRAKLIFSAKEAAYKAQYARSKTLFGFDAFSVTLSADSFTACFTQSVQGFSEGWQLNGRHIKIHDHYLTAVTA